jgi:hypothetical protein
MFDRFRIERAMSKMIAEVYLAFFVTSLGASGLTSLGHAPRIKPNAGFTRCKEMGIAHLEGR